MFKKKKIKTSEIFGQDNAFVWRVKLNKIDLQAKGSRRFNWMACNTSFQGWIPTVPNWTISWHTNIAVHWVSSWPLSRQRKKPTRWRSTWKTPATLNTTSGRPATSWARTCSCGWAQVFPSMPPSTTCWGDLATDLLTSHPALSLNEWRVKGNMLLLIPSQQNCKFHRIRSSRFLLLLFILSFGTI